MLTLTKSLFPGEISFKTLSPFCLTSQIQAYNIAHFTTYSQTGKYVYVQMVTKYCGSNHDLGNRQHESRELLSTESISGTVTGNVCFLYFCVFY